MGQLEKGLERGWVPSLTPASPRDLQEVQETPGGTSPQDAQRGGSKQPAGGGTDTSALSSCLCSLASDQRHCSAWAVQPGGGQI